MAARLGSAAVRIALAPNAFRGSITALDACRCLETGLRASALAESRPLEVVAMPLADGGDGTLDVLLAGLGGQRIGVDVTGPRGEPVRADFGLLGDGRTAIIEMARASGVELLRSDERDPRFTTTHGTGELIRAALDHGARRLLVGIGGSATNDGGAGCAAALGFELLDESGEPIPPGGAGLALLDHIDADDARRWLDSLSPLDIRVLSDVTNPLVGPDGATYTFARQKGATDDMLPFLDGNLARLADVMRRDLGVDVEHLPGAGAAGGLGAGLMAFLGAQLVPGGAAIIDLLGYAEKLAGCDLVITGEGALDAQTGGGKGVQRIAEVAAQAGVPVVALAGALKADPAALRALGIHAAWSIVPGPMALSDALANAETHLTRAATMVGNVLALGRE